MKLRRELLITLLVVLSVITAALLVHVAVEHSAQEQQQAFDAPYEGQGVPMPSRTEGHHGGEFAGEALHKNNSSFLQHGSPDAERDDYLIVCGGTASRPVTGHVYNVPTGFHGVKDAGPGCKGRDFPFNGEGHSIQGRDYSLHD
jgi:hypothetical protein